MTMQEVGKMLALMKITWPNFYAKQSRENAEAALRMWFDVLQNEHSEVVMCALRDCITTCKFPPVPADICTRIQGMKNASLPGAGEAFAQMKKAAKRGLYNAEEEYEVLPAACKEYLGGPSGLRDLAMLDENTLETVARGQFMKQYDNLVERQRVRAGIPDNVKALLDGMVERLPQLEEAGA